MDMSRVCDRVGDLLCCAVWWVYIEPLVLDSKVTQDIRALVARLRCEGVSPVHDWCEACCIFLCTATVLFT